ncbi:hypothetical protein BDZ97DRAFT_1916032 [Flammula alnicola]|nr:hypothetical protein BDZ97DRAFT_1916032 [Flammula alnicola]
MLNAAAKVECNCFKCYNLEPLLKRISRTSARKHLTKNGPAPLVIPPQNHAIAQPPALGPLELERNAQDVYMGYQDFGVDEPGLEDPPNDVPFPPLPVQPADTTWTHATMPNEVDTDLEADRQSAVPILPPAYRDEEPSCVRIAYLQAVLNNVFEGMPINKTDDNLATTLNALDAAGVLPEHPRPVRTLASAKRRLGIDPDEYIIQYAVCPQCWKHFTPEAMVNLDSPACPIPSCDGVIYEETTDSKNRVKRRAIKIIPQVSLLQSVRRMVRRKGFRRIVRDSRNTPSDQNSDPNFVMKDMYDGNIWHDLKTGIKREVGNLGTVRDVSIAPGSEKKLTDYRFGLHMNINLD